MQSVDEEVDRLSSLANDLIYKILSYVDIIYSLRLSVLSSRWRFIRTTMPTLNFQSHEVYSISSRYHEFVNDVLSARNNKIDVSSIILMLADVEDTILSVKRILEYAFSHNVQQLTVIWLREFQSPPFLLSSNSLKYLKMIGTLDCRSHSPWDLPALTTLHLYHVELYNCSSIVAICQNLKNLTLERCKVFEDEDSNGFTIINSRLVSLTLKKVDWYVGFVLVDTPQLKNFIFVDTPHWQRKTNALSELTISAPGLTYLRIKGSDFPNLSLDEFCSLDKVDLCISSPQKTDVHKIRDLFQRLHSVKSLALSLEIVELLSTSKEVISHQLSPFTSLKSFKIYPLQGLKAWKSEYCIERYPLKSILDMFETQPDQEQEAMTIKLCVEVTNYFLGSSSNATFTMVSHEEARAIKITIVAYHTMTVLWEILGNIEAYTDTKRANVEWKKTLADSFDEDFNMKIRPPGNTKVIFCMLQNIRLLLTKVLASKRVEMQARFLRLCAKTKSVVNKMAVDMKNQCDMKQHIFSGYVDEIALSL
uniref:F-box domain-containing protein n=1 Tax=Tanacetum cinerariifolium TaxID=118510 RepID=A0A6L2KD77_TANCI|nr:hypothetical protein [Tanacetum cinerariifolium]